MFLLKKIRRVFLKLNKAVMLKAVASATVLVMTLTICDFSAKCDGIRENVLRLHILANSDSNEDQELKLKVRDAILEISDEVFSECNSENEAVQSVERSKELIVQTARNIIHQNGYDYSVSVEIANTWFEDRKYDDFTLPSGNYEALRVIIGEGKGHNWWCVMFPAVCIPAAIKQDKISDVLTEEQTEIVQNPQKYTAKFKVIELFHGISKKVRSIFGF